MPKACAPPSLCPLFGKAFHTSERLARRAIRDLKRTGKKARDGYVLSAYVCFSCNHFHIGHKRTKRGVRRGYTQPTPHQRGQRPHHQARRRDE